MKNIRIRSARADPGEAADPNLPTCIGFRRDGEWISCGCEGRCKDQLDADREADAQLYGSVI